MPHHHPLVLTSTPYGSGNSWICNRCQSSFVHEPSNHCFECNFDLCANCINSLNHHYQRPPPPPAQNPFHPHPLTLSKPYGGLGWTCAKCGVRHSGQDLANHCELCRYDVCADCIKWNAPDGNAYGGGGGYPDVPVVG